MRCSAVISKIHELLLVYYLQAHYARRREIIQYFYNNIKPTVLGEIQVKYCGDYRENRVSQPVSPFDVFHFIFVT